MRIMAAMLLLFLGAGCGGKYEEDDVWYSSTLVQGFEADGTPRVTISRVSRKDQLAVHAARKAALENGIGVSDEALGVANVAQGNCWLWSSTVAWDQINWSGNEICFSEIGGFAMADLNNYDLTGSSGIGWWSRIRSYYVAGQTCNGHGYFQTPAPGNYQEWFNCAPGYNDCGAYKTAGFAAQNSRYVFLGYGC